MKNKRGHIMLNYDLNIKFEIKYIFTTTTINKFFLVQ